ncbi:hypothetical protein [Arthrobacter sp. NPDC090010]|uniref:hypothetical protein n=1 Tax=Arthrobacter sp. NPDC090010 TaxID=3363942 RepID=UPI0037F776B4
MNDDVGRRPGKTPSRGAWRRRASQVKGAPRRILAPWRRRPEERKRSHRNGRGLFIGAVIGGILGYFAGRAIGQGAYGIILGALAGAAILYRLNPGPWKREDRRKNKDSAS